MVKLNAIFQGAQDIYLYGESKTNTLKSQFLETKRLVATKEYNNTMEDLIQEIEEAHEHFMESPSEHIAYYISILSKHKDDLVNGKRNQRATRIEIAANSDPGTVGYTNLRFKGDPKKIDRITLFSGGQEIDRIYPALLGKFDPISIFDFVIPKSAYHTLVVAIDFLQDSEEDSQLTVEWDVVNILEDAKENEVLFSCHKFYKKETISVGTTSVFLQYLNPVEELTIYTEKPVENMILSLTTQICFHVPYKGVENGKHIYKYRFQTPVNFSRIDNACLIIKSATSNTIYPFAKTKNILRTLGGLTGLVFSP